MRIRSIHPRFWRSLTLAKVTREERLFFAGLWNVADDEGRGVADPRLLKGDLFPLDDDVGFGEISGWLTKLSAVGVIQLYRDKTGRPLYHVVSWSEHQRPEKPKPSALMPPPAPRKNRGRVGESSEIGPRKVRDGSGTSGGWKGKGNGVGEREQERERSPASDEVTFEVFWATYPSRPNNPRATARLAWDRLLKAGVDPAAIIAGARAYKAYVTREKTEPKFIKQASTFLGPGHHWESDYGAAPPVMIRVYDENGMPTPEAAAALGLTA